MEEKKRAPWMPIDAAWWPTIAAEMPPPWTRAAVLMDLRWWADQEKMGRVKRPGRPALCKRWGWTDWQARAAMKDEASWGANLQPASNAPPTSIQDSPPKPLESQEPTSSPPPTHIQPASPRADIQNNTTHNTNLSECSKEHSSNLGLKDLWDQVNVIRFQAGHRRPLKLNKARHRVLAARVSEYSEVEVLRVVSWWMFSKHERATFLRAKGLTIATILRPSNFADYLDFAHEPEPTHAPKQRRGAAYVSVADRLAEAEALRDHTPGVVVDFTPKTTGVDNG